MNDATNASFSPCGKRLDRTSMSVLYIYDTGPEWRVGSGFCCISQSPASRAFRERGGGGKGRQIESGICVQFRV